MIDMMVTLTGIHRFTLYGETPETKGNSNYLLWLVFPLVPATLGLRYPNTISTCHTAQCWAVTDKRLM